MAGRRLAAAHWRDCDRALPAVKLRDSGGGGNARVIQVGRWPRMKTYKIVVYVPAAAGEAVRG
ncbi:MAG: hypothetical protein E6645_32205, partial [Bradyrhizobium sp.]|nr:hypothetical protein [Bradyrhizobium sp.]